MFIRVKDKTTKHEFDVSEDDWRIAEDIFTPIKSDRFPPVDRPREPKFYTPTKNVKEVKSDD
ncbi:hypothetical protein PP635_gp14 [Arthrobacter phage Auxilium]|uniref:Uncharacterized protein n=2 Tax=Richievirus TaxID=3044803 RepID=A0A3G2KIM7_9CAUD|nr:hypothetical protein PP634_gp14 [Arthrobacter phage Richie]YP_010655833.1 hypothetical protein PP635_gp14 [Arthrobacter phage Auxilium]UVF60976.1 hypothetical protein SEA_GORPY_14 [Arthrobacter phage Gorpy]UVK61961.1 hypothetical protein SEA_SAKAI_14 [Arthrobacter phage Sakai]AYN55794.1 hypothetical protein PBI_AUXILIUM_14 [Arthrobacter phage Auxilium]AYN58842.1 hypothetical protein PBI_RICHIE_14 [Arthrobacter phage Richie]